ncbi:thermonuclease family protein [Pseudomonas aeruginosa]|uniref:thermonuclease family protein n=2 Tax=Pseudomonas aeruginosa TaxID=287 RepID=UPI0009A4F367|nr:thermonuclease family protein [Pseudomonas aeruginosa]MCW5229513.1 thermonuclease family protein [Pseudomonas aeruginosa]MDP5840672.1 thermonuclease family protein [Pseudomonas aeruginosa]MDX4056510.1 thermonuclease family protein [Pseudomonas aeruginosa]
MKWILILARLLRYIGCLALIFSVHSQASEITCKVVAISDGDTFTCLTDDKNEIKVRLAEIDTPEKAQPYGNKSKAALASLIFKKKVTVSNQGSDRYSRTLGAVYLDGLYVNREMVRIGAAWVYRQYNRDKSLLKDEEDARSARLGIWSQPEAEIVPPWEWRKAGKNLPQAIRESKSALASTISKECGTKRYCTQMSSCEEAEHHLLSCGLKSLDRDGDGVPCENLCAR